MLHTLQQDGDRLWPGAICRLQGQEPVEKVVDAAGWARPPVGE
jgi:hypothetical protein